MLRANFFLISEKPIQPFSREECSPFSSSLISRSIAFIFSYSSMSRISGLPLSAISAIFSENSFAFLPITVYNILKEKPNKTNFARSNARTHGSDFVTLRLIQRPQMS